MEFLRSVKSALKEFYKKYISTEILLLIITVICALSLMYHYFKREDSVSFFRVAGTIVHPFQEGINKIGNFLFEKELERITVSEAREMIEALEKENLTLQKEITDLKNLRIENEKLRKLLGAKQKYSQYEMTEADITGSDGTNIFYRFTVNKGSRDGIKVNMNVINGDGLVGIITYTGFNYSVVTAIIEDNISISSKTKNTDYNFILNGGVSTLGKNKLYLKNIPAEADTENDSTIVTSSISEKFLPGLLIGYADKITLNEGGLTKSGIVNTAVDFSTLDKVLIITTLPEKKQEEGDND